MERLDMDDKLMNSEKTDNGHKLAEMKEVGIYENRQWIILIELDFFRTSISTCL